MIIEVPFKLEYQTRGTFTPKEVAAALLAADSLLTGTGSRIVDSIFGPRLLSGFSVGVYSISTGSLYEDFFVKFVFGSRENFERKIQQIRQTTGLERFMENSTPTQTIAVILSAGLISLAISTLIPHCTNPDNQALIEGSNNIVIAGANELNIDPNALTRLLAQSREGMGIAQKRALANSSLDLLKPIKHREDGALVINGNPNYVIDHGMAAVLPDEIAAEPEVYTEMHRGVVLNIRSLDRDNQNNWKAIIPNLSEKRVKLIVDASIDLLALARQETITGDVQVTIERRTPEAPERIKEYHLISLSTAQQ